MRPDPKRAFTAIEMLFVLALMAIAAAGASLSLAQIQRNSDLAAVLDRLKYFDSLTRRQAMQSGRPLMLAFDTATVTRAAISATPNDSPMATLQLPDGFAIDQAKIAAVDQTVVPISAAGLSPTYAILISRRGQRRWLIVSAVGEARAAEDDGTIEYEIDQLRQP